MIKLIVCDFDGTILERSTQLIYPRVAEALRKAKADGIEFCAATGRNAPAARRILEGSKVEGWMIDLNGAELRDPQGQVRAVQALDKNLVQRLLPKLRHPEVLTTLYSGRAEIYISARRGALSALFYSSWAAAKLRRTRR